MALSFTVAIRNNMLNQITAALDAGTTAALVRIYDGVRPATGGAATVLLAELVCTDPVAPVAASGVLTFSTINQDTSANATGTATWFRLVDSAAVFVFDGSVATSGSDLNLTTTAIVLTQPVSITSATITAGNA